MGTLFNQTSGHLGRTVIHSDPWLFFCPLLPTLVKKDNGLTAWPAPGGHSCGPGQLPAASLLGAGQPTGWIGGSEEHCRGRRFSPGGRQVRDGVIRLACPLHPSPLPTFAFCPTPLSPSRLGSNAPSSGKPSGLPPAVTPPLPWVSIALYSVLRAEPVWPAWRL